MVHVNNEESLFLLFISKGSTCLGVHIYKRQQIILENVGVQSHFEAKEQVKTNVKATGVLIGKINISFVNHICL